MNKNLKVVIVGGGWSGRILATTFEQTHSVVTIDTISQSEPLEDIIERERGLTITNPRVTDFLTIPKNKDKKPYFRKGK